MEKLLKKISRWIVLTTAVAMLAGCGLVKVPFRVAGALTEGVYRGGKKVVDASSQALEKRKLKKDQEAAQAEKTKAIAKPLPDESAIPLPGAVEAPALPIE